MARTRDLRPGFFKNERLGECQPLARLLFAGLWVYADREGRLEDRPKRLRSEILPYDNCDADELLNELEQFEFIVRYEVEGKRYIQITGFLENQRVHPKEQPSVIPANEYIQSRGLPLQGGDLPLANRTIPSSPSIPSLPSNSSPVGEAQSAAHPIWGDALQMLVDQGEKEHSARAFLGRALKEYGEGALNEAISACILQPPVNFKAYLLGCLKAKPKPASKTNGLTLGRPTIVPGEQRQGGVLKF